MPNAHRKPIGGSPISVEKTTTFCVSLTPEGLVFDDPMEPLRQARIGFGSTKIVLQSRALEPVTGRPLHAVQWRNVY